MKNILNKYIPFLLAFSITVIITLFTSCDYIDDDVTGSGAPVITEIRNYAASPNDTLVDKIVPGQWIVIHGKNLKDAKQITFNGSIASFDHGLFSDETAVVQVPWSVPFNNVDPALLHTINYTTKGGTTSFKFDVIPPLATITGNSMSSATMEGDSIYIYGTNLYLIEKLTLAGIDVPSFTTVDNGSSVGFLLPKINAPMPWAGVLVAASGTYEFEIEIVPEIFAISYANPSQGDLVRVYGKNLNGVSSFSFGSKTITAFTVDEDGFYVEFLAPDMNFASGPVTLVNSYGTATTVYNINTRNEKWLGLLANFEWGDYFGYHWWGDISLAFGPVADFNGSMGTNNSMYIYFNTPILAGGESKYAPLGNANNTSINNKNAWMPVANLSDPVENWGLQFDISVAKPWKGGTLYFKTEFAGESYVARYEPWKISASKTVAFETEGWQTVTIPLSQFKSKKTTLGDGDSVTSLKLLLGPTGETSYDLTLKNFASSSTATGFYAAIDNIRVVKIKE